MSFYYFNSSALVKRYVNETGTAWVISITDSLAEAHDLRGYDATQLAAAMDVNAYGLASGMPKLILVSADSDLNAAAAAEGLNVDDPNARP